MRLAAALCLLGTLGLAQDAAINGVAQVTFRVSDADKARAFYTGLLGFPEPSPLHFSINRAQSVELQPGLPAGENVRVSLIAFSTHDAGALRKALVAKGVDATPLQRTSDYIYFRLRDPDGNPLEIRQPTRTPAPPEAPRISTHLMHAGIPVSRANYDAAMHFYGEILGFQEFWRGGPENQPVAWINLRTPGTRGDYVELMLHDGNPSRSQLGSMQHICLEVPSIEESYAELLARGVPTDDRYKPRKGRNQRMLLNLFDPDGSRTELMEPTIRP